MPPRRGGRRRGASQKPGDEQDAHDGMENQGNFINIQTDENKANDALGEIQNGTGDSAVGANEQGDPAQNDGTKQESGVSSNETSKTENGEGKGSANATEMPFKVKVSHLPPNYNLSDFLKYLRVAFDLQVPRVISPGRNSPWLLIPCATKEEQENYIKLLHNHDWKRKALRATAFYGTSLKRPHEEGEEESNKKWKTEEIPVLTLEEEILSESLPLYNVPYEEQNRLTLLDVQLLSNKLHAFMCVRNPALAGWAEAMCEQNDGVLFKVDPLKASPLLKGYRNKCKFRIGKNTEEEITVGFCLNDNENKILSVQPGDELLHLPDSMKYAAKKCEGFFRASGKEPYNKKQKKGFWDHIIIRVAPDDSLMLVVVMYHNNLPDESITELKNQVKDYFVNGDGKDCKLYSLYFQLMNDKAPILPSDKLELLYGQPHFYKTICGIKFFVGPFSILNVNSSASEIIYNSIAELAEPTPDTTVLDLCAGTGGIAFTIANKCKNVIAIESQEDHIKDALKTKEENGVANVEFIKGKVEDELGAVFEKLCDGHVIPIIDPPRQGLAQKAISQLRSRENIKKLVYVCPNSKIGTKNFLDLCASSEKKEGTFGNPLNVQFDGLPFLPVRAIPIDVAPYTVNNTIIILFERVDPSTFPPAKNPPPTPMKKPQTKPDERKKRRSSAKKIRGGGSGRADSRGRKLRGGKSGSGSGSRSGFRGQFSKRGGRQGKGSGFNQSRFPPPLLRPMEPALSLVAKYERRIAELEQQDRAFKAGLTMGLQALGTRGGAGGNDGGNAGNFDFGNGFNGNLGNLGNDFGNFRNQGNNRSNSVWQRGNSGSGGGRNSFGNLSLGDSFGSGFNTGFGNFDTSGSFSSLGNTGSFNNLNSAAFGNLGSSGGGFGSFGSGSNFNSGFGNSSSSSNSFRSYSGSKRRR